MDQDLCYICFGDSTENGGFLDSTCSCTGSLKIHLFCLARLIMNNHIQCMTCKNVFKPVQDQKMLVIQKCNLYHVIIQQVNHNYKQDGTSYIYLMSSETQIKIRECNYSKGKKHGTSYEWNYSVKKKIYYLAKEINYNMNVLHGTKINYYPNGVCETLTNYLNGKKHGDYIRRYENNILMQKSKYNNGKKHGAFLSFYPNGSPDIICIYKNGIFDGQYMKFKRNGAVLQCQMYIDGTVIEEPAKEFLITSVVPKRRYSV